MMLARNAWLFALTEDGPGDVAAICEAAYGAGIDLIDLDAVRAAVADGRTKAILSEIPVSTREPVEQMRRSIAQIIAALR